LSARGNHARHENSGAAAAHQQLLSGRRISPQAGVWLLRALACQRYALGVLVLQHEGPFSCCMLLRPAPTVAWQAGAGSLTRCFATPDPRATDLAEPILAACMQGCSPPPRLSWLLVARLHVQGHLLSVAVLSACLSVGGTQCRPDQAGRICSQHSCCDATTLKDLRATGCISARSSALRATGALLSNHTATRRVGSVGRGDAGSLTRCFAAPNPWTTDLPKPILAACMQGCSPPPRLSVRVAPRCASACARSSPVCRSPVSLSVYRQRWHTVQA
jgi:hypothetical protein